MLYRPWAKNLEHGTDAAASEQLRRSALMDLVARVLMGAYAHPGLLIVLAVSTPFRVDHPVLFWSSFSVCFASVGARIVISHWRKALYCRGSALLHTLLFFTVLSGSAVSGLLYVSTVRFYGLESWPFAIVMMFMVGIASGSTISFVPDFTLLTYHLVLIFSPTLALGLWTGGKNGNTFAVATVILISFLLLQGRRLHRVYWSVIRSQASEAARNKELEVARAAAVAASVSKSRFLANMSHEIRTPMHGILGMAELALDAETDAEAKDLVRTLRQAAGGLLTVLNDVLDFSKIEAGKLTLENTPFSLQQLIVETQSIVTPHASAKGLTLRCFSADDVPNRLVGDPARLRQVLINLVGNAVKFTKSGSVTLEVTRPTPDEEPTGDRVILLFRVSDTGIGIPEDQQELIFEAFSQADSSVARKFGGTGLGLAICSQLVQLMGSKLTLQSKLAHGSVFQFVCAFGETPGLADASQPTAIMGPAPPMRILLAEDNPISQKLATKLLTRHGHQVRVAETGQAAVAAWEAEEFDLILMDNQMPEMDGMEAVHLIRTREGATTRRRTTIVACSASALTSDSERFLAAGMDATLSKPFQADELYAVLRSYSPSIPSQ